MLPEQDEEVDLENGLARLTEQVSREHERAAHREQIIDRLHAENQDLRRGLLQEALTPVRSGLYRLYDTVTREAARREGADPVVPLLEAIAEEVAEVLARTGAERLEVSPGDPYDPALHRPLRTEPGEDGRIVAVVSDGFRLAEQDRVLRKAGVVIGRNVQQSEEND
ncbi:nucleotide exchange factor GrpE [Acrocarpospora sp. B8E8]|uniref:nucleotide exchange factor GrpE n=1 Tax=Acrocarpospora sp. B8E8 TaxID=3153572 RepID=UPI00325F606E